MSQLLDSKAFSKLCGEIGKAYATVQEKVQIAATNAIGYSSIHGDIRQSNQLLKSFGKGLRKQALVSHLEKYSPVVFLSSSSEFVYDKSRADEFKEFDYETMLAILWVDSKKETIKSDLDAEALTQSLINRLTKKGKEGVSNFELVEFLEKALSRFKDEKSLKNAKALEEGETQ